MNPSPLSHTMMMVVIIAALTLATTVSADCDKLKSVVTSKDPIFGAKQNSCSCANGGESVNCNVNRPCLSLGDGATILNGQSYKASVTSSTPGETFTSNTIVDTCFKYNNDHPTFSNSNVCITMVYDSLGGPRECTKMTVEGQECHFCQGCAIPSGQGGGDSFIFNCTNIGYGENYKAYQEGGGCTPNNAADTIGQFFQNHEICPDGTPGDLSSSAAASSFTPSPVTLGGTATIAPTILGGGSSVGGLVNSTSGKAVLTLMMMLSVTIVTTMTMMIF